MKIRFLNFELDYSCGSSLMQGFTNLVYGQPSRWNGALAAQEVIVDVKDEAEYLRIIQDIKAAYHMPMRRWVPVPEFSEAVVKVPEQAQQAASQAANSSLKAAGQTADELSKQHHKTLRKLAASEGINVSDCQGGKAIAERIVSERLAKAA